MNNVLSLQAESLEEERDVHHSYQIWHQFHYPISEPGP